MMRTTAIAILGALVLSGCAKQEKVTAEDISSYQLTEADISKFIEAFPKVDKIMTEATKNMTSEELADPYKVFASLQLTEDQEKAIKEAGFSSTAEFLKVVGAITATWSAYSMEKAVEDVKAEMAKTLESVPASKREQMKQEMDKQIAEMEAKSKVEYTISDHNLQLIKDHYDELTKAFLSGM